MTPAEREEFARLLILSVRDPAIMNCDGTARSAGPGPVPKRWREAAARGPEALLREAIPDCIDTAVFYLLLAIDNGDLPLRFVTSTGRVIDLREEGMAELAGWYANPDDEGWRRKYSKERIVDRDDLAPE